MLDVIKISHLIFNNSYVVTTKSLLVGCRDGRHSLAAPRASVLQGNRTNKQLQILSKVVFREVRT